MTKKELLCEIQLFWSNVKNVISAICIALMVPVTCEKDMKGRLILPMELGGNDRVA